MTHPSDLLSQHNWFATATSLDGTGSAHIRSVDATISGPVHLETDRLGRLRIELQFESIVPESVHFFQIAIDAHDFDRFESDTPAGKVVATRVDYSGCFSGNEKRPASFRLSPRNAELIVSDDTPAFWVLPLSNFTSHFVRLNDYVRNCPLRIGSEQRVIPFTWAETPAFIEPLLDYSERGRGLEEGETRNLITSVMIGEVGGRSIELADVDAWLPISFLRVLGFATGNQIGSPWMEFRTSDGKLVKRVYRGLGAPTFTNGRRIIEEVLAPNTARLLEAVQTPPFSIDLDNVYRVLLHHAERAGADGETIDDRLSHLYRAFDRLCKENGFGKVFLRTAVAEPARTDSVKILKKATDDLSNLALQSTAAGDLTSANALQRIANRISGVDQTDRDFGTAVCSLVQKYGLHDEAAMNAYLSVHPLASNISTWRSMLSELRNINAHDAFYNTSLPTYAIDNIYGLNLHLLDLLARILLIEMGYTGMYHPVAAIEVGTQRPLDWVTPNTTISEFGYQRLN